MLPLPRALHESNRPSLTAQTVTLWRALELQRREKHRIVTDEYAPLFLPSRVRHALPAMRLTAPVRDAAAHTEPGGTATFVLARHRYLDELVLAARDAEQVLILGAGWDSRAWRLAGALAGRTVWEVDLPALSRLKASVVATHPDRFADVARQRVEVDFRVDSLAERLTAAGFPTGRRTVVVWEGVAMYLTREAVLSTLGTLAELCGPGSLLGLDLWDSGGGGGALAPLRRAAGASLALIGEPVTFGVRPVAADALLAQGGWQAVDFALSSDLERRFVPDGRRCVRSIYVVSARLN